MLRLSTQPYRTSLGPETLPPGGAGPGGGTIDPFCVDTCLKQGLPLSNCRNFCSSRQPGTLKSGTSCGAWCTSKNCPSNLPGPLREQCAQRCQAGCDAILGRYGGPLGALGACPTGFYANVGILKSVAPCADSQILTAPDGSCVTCCSFPRKPTCGPGEKLIDRDAQGCALCCPDSKAAAAAGCADPAAVSGPDVNGCYSCNCRRAPAPAPSCPSGTLVTNGLWTCCKPLPSVAPYGPPIVTTIPPELPGAPAKPANCVVTTATPVKCPFGQEPVINGPWTCCQPKSSSPGKSVAVVAGLALVAFLILRR